MPCLLLRATLGAFLGLAFALNCQAVNRDWDGGGVSSNWSEIENWDPNGDPGGDDLTIAGVLSGAGPHTALDSDFVVSSLTISNSSEVDTVNYLLAVEGHTQLSGDNTRLQLRERTTGGDGDSLDTDTMSIGSGSFVEMYENSVLEVDNGALSVFGTLVGNGDLELNDNPASPTALLSIFGLLSAGQAGTFIGAPPPRTLSITAADPDARIGMSLNGLIEVQENGTLNNGVRMLNDDLENLRLWPNSTYRVEHSWTLSGDIDMTTNAFSGTAPATIAGGQGNPLLTLGSGSTVTVDSGESLRFDMQLSGNNGSTLANTGTVIFDAPAQFEAMAGFQLSGFAPQMIVNSDVMILQDNFDIDGGSGGFFESGEVTVNSGAKLNVLAVDFGSGDTTADGTLTINRGEMYIDLLTDWTMNGTLNLSATAGSTATLGNLEGGGGPHALRIGDGSGASDANVVVTGASRIDFRAVRFDRDADVDISLGAVLDIVGIGNYSGEDATFDGEGTLKPGLMVVNAPTTFNVAVVDLDDNTSPGSGGHVLNQRLTINADAIDEEGDGFDGDMLITNASGNGRLVVNSTSGMWRFNAGTITAANVAAFGDPIRFEGSDIEVGEFATIEINGLIATEARLEIEGLIDLPGASDWFELRGGSTMSPNRIRGVVTGDGRLQIHETELRGFGIIQPDITGTSNSRLVADDGHLIVSGIIASLGEIVVTDDGLFDFGINPLGTAVLAGDLILEGGLVAGSQVTNGVGKTTRGHGTLNSRIVNEGIIRAEGGLLTLDPPSGLSSYDGTTGDGTLLAVDGDLLLRNNIGVVDQFSGTMSAGPGREIAVEYRFGLNLGAELNLNAATFRTTQNTLLRGSIIVNGAAPSRIVTELSSPLAIVRFEDGTTTLNADLELLSATADIEATATFVGSGSLINLQDSHITLADGVDMAVPLVNNGLIGIGTPGALGDNSLGEVALAAYTQHSTGDLIIDLNGLGGGQFDTLMVDNNAILEGTLTVNLLGTFTPVLGNSWTILTTSLGLVDADELTINAPVINDLTFELVAGSNNIVLNVVEAGLPGDFDDDGDVDVADALLGQRLGEDLGPGSDWATNFGTGSAPLSAFVVVPEPTACLLAQLGVLVACRRRR